MANNLFGGLGNVLGGVVNELAKSGLAPQDDPNVKLINVQSELSDLRKKETELFAAIGRAAYEANPSGYPQSDAARQVQGEIAAAEEQIKGLEQEIKAAETSESAGNACPSCGYENADGVKFCSECGAKLETAEKFCGCCGAKNEQGTNFCRECGVKL